MRPTHIRSKHALELRCGAFEREEGAHGQGAPDGEAERKLLRGDGDDGEEDSEGEGHEEDAGPEKARKVHHSALRRHRGRRLVDVAREVLNVLGDTAGSRKISR